VLKSNYPYSVVKEELEGSQTELTDFYFRYGANIYVFSYEKDGQRKHTFIDSGYLDHKKRIIPVLEQNRIDLKHIERIIITHRHTDHCGLARQLALKSGARITAHANFRSFVEGDLTPREKVWMGKLNPARLKDCDMEYLAPSVNNGSVEIEGVNFPRLGDPIPIGNSGMLEILACPENEPTHSPDQLLVRYSKKDLTDQSHSDVNHSPSIGDMLFSGDLWLMTGPIFERNFRVLPRMLKYSFYRFKERMAGREINWVDPRDQDADVKEALKQGFSLIRVKPGHGSEFLGCRILPNALLADRDILMKLGYSINENPVVLKSAEASTKVAELKENAYAAFKEELQYWLKMGADPGAISKRLARIYREQKGGGRLVEFDRNQRRKKLKETLARLEQDDSVPDDLRQVAKKTSFD